jgi:hypothetical protein
MQRRPQTATVMKPGTETVGSCTSSKASESANFAEPLVAASRMISRTPTAPISTPVEIRCRRFSPDSTKWVTCSASAGFVTLTSALPR